MLERSSQREYDFSKGRAPADFQEHLANLEAAGLRVTAFDQARENPTTKCVDACLATAKAAGASRSGPGMPAGESEGAAR